MDPRLEQMIRTYEARVGTVNAAQVTGAEFGPHPQLKVLLLGQFSLLVQPEFTSRVTVVSTQDVDAQLDGSATARDIFKGAIRDAGFRYDEQSDLMWMPDDGKRFLLYESALIKVEAFEPFAVLVSKGVKAPEKNRALIIEAVSVFGESLLEEIERHDGQLGFIIEGE